VTSSYLEGEQNALGNYGYNRGWQEGEITNRHWLADRREGETAGGAGVCGQHGGSGDGGRSDQRSSETNFRCRNFVFVGDRGMGIKALEEAHLRYITALTDPQIRRLLGQKVLQLEAIPRTDLRGGRREGAATYCGKNEMEAARERHRMEDKLGKLERKIAARNEEVQKKPRCNVEAGQRKLRAWAERHKLTGLVEWKVEGRRLVGERQTEKIEKELELAGCNVVTTDVLKPSMSAQEVHDSYMSLQKVERDFRALKTDC